jgi:hypothetical protein
MMNNPNINSLLSAVGNGNSNGNGNHHPPPLNYSDMMRTLAAKYHNNANEYAGHLQSL